MFVNYIGVSKVYFFQVDYPRLLASKAVIVSTKGARHDFKVVLDGLNFLNSYWKFYGGNVEIISCNAASLVLELKYLKHAIIQNCTFGHWLFQNVNNAFIKNCNIVFHADISKSLVFFNSSAYIKNITVKQEFITGLLNGIYFLNNSLIHIEQSTFINNTVKKGLLKALWSSSLIMSNCVVLENHATDYAGFIYARKSFVHLKNTYFNGNMAKTGGGVIFIWMMSSLQIKKCTFKNNSADRVIGVGGVIFSANDSLLDISYSIFDHNKAGVGGAIYQQIGKVKLNHCSFFGNFAKHTGGAVVMNEKSVLWVVNTTFINNTQISASILNTSDGGGAIFLFESVGNISKSTFENNFAVVTGGAIRSVYCSMNIEDSTFQNNSVSDKVQGEGGAMFLYGNCTVKISNVLFSKCNAFFGGVIGRFANSTSIIMSNSSVIANTGSAILLTSGDTLEINNSTFFNNTSSRAGGAVKCKANCVLKMVNTKFRHNKSGENGGAVVLGPDKKNSKDKRISNLAILNCTFTDNFALKGGAIASFYALVKIVNSNFLQNIASIGGVIYSLGNLVMKNCYTSNNTALEEAAVIYTANGTLLMTNSLVLNNTSNGIGGVLYSTKSEIVIKTSIFKTNTAHQSGGVMNVHGGTMLLSNSSFVKSFARFSGGVLFATDQAMINITQSFFFENKADFYTGMMSIADTTIIISDTNISYNSGSTCGAIRVASNSSLELYKSQIEGNNAKRQVGALCIFDNSLLVAVNYSFKGNSANQDSTIHIDNSIVFLEKCNFSGNRLTYGGTITTRPGTTLKVSNTVFTQNEGFDIVYPVRSSYFITKFETYRCLFMHGNISLKSNVKNFEQVAVKEKVIDLRSSYLNQRFFKPGETPYASSKM